MQIQMVVSAIAFTLQIRTKTDKKYPWLVYGDKWTERKGVYYYDSRVKKGAPVSPTANNVNSIGPELGFGYVMGHVLSEPVLVLKSFIGNCLSERYRS